MTDVQICNQTLSRLGNYGSVMSIDTPKNSKEIAFANWYSLTRQWCLKESMPNFALERRFVAKLGTNDLFGYAYRYEYPQDCLKVLGIGNVEEKANNYAIESYNGIMCIFTDMDYEGGLPLRYIKDVTDTARFTPEFTLYFILMLGKNVAMEITQDINKVAAFEAKIPMELSALSGVNAQENKPIRKSTPRFSNARNGYGSAEGKK